MIYKVEDLFLRIRNGMNVKQELDAGGLPITRIETIANAKINLERVGHAGLTLEQARNYLLEDGEILFSHINSVSHIGKCALYAKDMGELVHGMNLLSFKPNQTLLFPKYALYALRSQQFKDQLVKSIKKSVNQASVSIGDIKNITLHVPPIADQKRIAAILDKAAEIKAKREQAIAKLDDLAQSTFIEMFGDLAANKNAWKIKHLKEISVTKGQYGGGFSAAEYQPSSPRYVRITDITDEGELKPDAVSADGDANDFANYYLADGDLLFARSGATVGKAYLHKSKLPHIYAGYLIRFVIDIKQALPEYVFAVTRTQYYKNWVLSKQNVVAQPNINAQQYGDLKIPIPPISLQYQYAQFRDKLLKQKRSYDTSLATLSHLAASLQYQAFTTGFAT